MIAAVALLGLPFLTAVALALPQPAATLVWLDRIAGLLMLAVAIGAATLPVVALPLLRHDHLGSFAAILIACVALAWQPNGTLVGKYLTLGGMVLAGLSINPFVREAGLIVAVSAALAPQMGVGWYRVPLAGAGLGVLLFGSILPPAPLASGCALAGLATLAIAVPVLLPVLPLLALRHAGPELVALGVVSVAGCAVGLLLWPARKPRVPWIAVGQAGVIGVLFGLHSVEAIFAGLVLAALLALSQAARALATGDGLTRLLAVAGVAGLPPFGVFPGLTLAIVVVAKQAPWLLLVLMPALAALGWVGIKRLPALRIAASDRLSVAWIPLVAAALLGWFMPDPVVDWLRALSLDLIE